MLCKRFSLNGPIDTRKLFGVLVGGGLFSKGLPVYYTGRQEKYCCVHEIISVYWSQRGPKGYVLRLNGKPRITIAIALFGWNYRSFLSIYVSKRQKEKKCWIPIAHCDVNEFYELWEPCTLVTIQFIFLWTHAFLFIHFQVLFGVVASLDKHSTHSFGATQRPSSGSHDQHNVMPLAPNPPRFTLLPLSFHLSPEIGAQTADLTRKNG